MSLESTLLGCAIGDAFGQPLEFNRRPFVQTFKVMPHNRWTDDTHMALYLGRALAKFDKDRTDEDAITVPWTQIRDAAQGYAIPHDAGLDLLGEHVCRQFKLWQADPWTPHTAPGGTCMRGVNSMHQLSWEASGVRGSDGCGAVMRIAPLAYVPFRLEQERLSAAALSAVCTHASAIAVESAVAAVQILHRIKSGHVVDATLIDPESLGLDPEGLTAKALRAAQRVEIPEDFGPWEHQIPDGGGGWRSASCLGIAACALLQRGSRGFMPVVEAAARIDGDSDSTGALAGTFAGALFGTRNLPSFWRDAVAVAPPGTQITIADVIRELGA